MPKADAEELSALILGIVPADGSGIGNQSLREQVAAAAKQARLGYSDTAFEQAREALIEAGKLVKGKGRGGSVRLADDALQTNGAELDGEEAEPDELTLTSQALTPPLFPSAPAKPKNKPGAPRAAGKAGDDTQVLSYRHADKRKNNPEVGLVHPDTDPETPRTRWAYDPHLDPALQFDVGRADTERLIDDALASGDPQQMRAALSELRRLSQPYLNWAGKAERTSFGVDTVSLHVHERIDPASILAAVRKRQQDAKRGQPSAQLGLFSAPFENLPLRDAIDFYRHEKGWSNRLIAGDSLLVMNSLLQKESMAGQVQMIYIDPPYGIRYGSNFQPFVNKRDVKDRKDEDLSQEPEMIKAFRDTWELGIHSYLAYLRDRLLLARELLSEAGSLFFQINDENLALARLLLDDVFGSACHVVTIPVKKKGSQFSTLLNPVNDYVIWYTKSDRQSGKVKFRSLFFPKQVDRELIREYRQFIDDRGRVAEVDDADLEKRQFAGRLFRANPLTSGGVFRTQSVPFTFQGRTFEPGARASWKASAITDDGSPSGMDRLSRSGRLIAQATQLRFRSFLDDFPFERMSNWWDGLGGASRPIYVVQTNEEIVQRCLLMSTAPGDLVLDPTCGSGTTAFVAEKWGRRWITCDTSRVAITLAKQRLMTAGYDYYELKYPHEGLKGDFIYKQATHVELQQIANNPEIDETHDRMHPAIDAALAQLNMILSRHARGVRFVIPEGVRKGEAVGLGMGESLLEWEVPFDLPEAWPPAAREPFDAFHAARQAMQRAMDASIAAHADQETLYDQPAKAKDKLRITGPFSVEAVPFPTVLALDEAKPAEEADVAIARSGQSSRHHQWRDELVKTGIRGKGGQVLRFAELETLPELRHLHCTGTLTDTGERVVVSFGPEHAALEQRQVELALNEAQTLMPRPRYVVFCAFTFDPEAAKDIDEMRWPGVNLLKAQMNTDLLTEDLKKARASNQSFWLMGQPEVECRLRKDGKYVITVHGFDYFDTVKGELVSGGKGKIAIWMLDTDYDERSLFPHQVFFPMAGKDEGWFKLRKDIRAELDETALAQFQQYESLPFEAGPNRKVAVKIVDDRGIESLKIIPL